ncbi:isoprenylcysteine carboxylmethyltransferase family protein [Hungatella hathewayi]|nr:isoprenylcysteine carboxylmethyltransferase family protein [Hungatella hathewayi]
MKDSWRAGIAENDKTEIVTSGIYQISRNPAFLGFDCVYIGLLLMFFNPILLIFSVFAIIMLHLQILQEEQYLPKVFGNDYINYKNKVYRYFGRKSPFRLSKNNSQQQ